MKNDNWHICAVDSLVHPDNFDPEIDRKIAYNRNSKTIE